MSVAITGAAGFLGGRLVAALAARGERVRAIDLPRARWDRMPGNDLVEIVHTDVTDAGAVRRALEGASRVLHVAAIYEIGARDPARMRAVNVEGTRNVLDAAEDAGALAVHVSTVAALGPTGEREEAESHWDEGTPRSPYQATKREAHLLARARMARGARVRVALPATIYGPGDPSLTGKVHAAVSRGLLVLGARGSMRLACVQVDDCADGVIRVMDRGRDGEEYVLAGASPRVRDWFDAFARASGRPPPRAWLPDAWLAAAARAASRVPRLPPLVREGLAMSDRVHWSFSGDKARRDLGWSPRAFDASLVELARQTVQRERRRRTPWPAGSRSV